MKLDKELFQKLNNYALIERETNKYILKYTKYVKSNKPNQLLYEKFYLRLQSFYTNINQQDDDIESSIETFKDWAENYGH